MNYPIVEMFCSINGEGLRAGEPAIFVRLAGCNLNCTYCDTAWANQTDTIFEEKTEREIADYINHQGIWNVTLTGGEPLLHKNIGALCQFLIENTKCRIEIETNGSVSLKELDELRKKFNLGISFTMDYKLPGSGMESHMLQPNFQYLTSMDVVKFVASSKSDMDRGIEMIQQYHLTQHAKVYFSPVFGKIKLEDMANYLVENKLNDVKMQLQMHKFIWDPNQRGV